MNQQDFDRLEREYKEPPEPTTKDLRVGYLLENIRQCEMAISQYQNRIEEIKSELEDLGCIV